MESNRKRIRIDYEPLTVVAHLRCTTPASPVTQVFNNENGQYEPDREITPTVILPEVIAHTSDGSWKTVNANSVLADMQWLVNGTDISTLTEWAGQYSIDASTGSTRGAITITRNIAPGTQAALKFKGVIVDKRLGVNLSVETEEVILTSSGKNDDNYSVSIGQAPIIRYNPAKDQLMFYEYMVAQGLTAASDAARANAKAEGSPYEVNVPISVYKGDSLITSGYSLKMCEVATNGAMTDIDPASNYEITSFSLTQIGLDLRLVDKADYMIFVYVDGEQVAQVQFSVGRIFPKVTCTPSNGTAIHPTDTERYDVAMATIDGENVDHPECVLLIKWFTETATIKAMEHNEGRETLFNIAETGIGDDWDDDWVDVYVEYQYKDKHMVATDENGNILTDESGNAYIFN
jgi:hypothetical protein